MFQLSGDVPIAESDIGVPDVLEPSGSLQLIDFKLPPPRELQDGDRTSLIKTSLSRIWTEAQDSNNGAVVEPIPVGGGSSTEMWMLLIVRMITRVAPPPETSEESEDSPQKDEDQDAEPDLFARQDGLRQTLCDYIMSDFPSRCV